MEEKLFVTVSLSISKVEANKPLSAPRRQNRLRHRHICRNERRGKRDRRRRDEERDRWREK
jgi:hypothetical protein